MSSNFTATQRASLLVDVRTLLFNTENGGIASNVTTFHYAGGSPDAGNTFGIMQFNANTNNNAETFLRSIGFTEDQIDEIDEPNKLPPAVVNPLNALLAANQIQLDAFTDNQIESSIDRLDQLVTYLKGANTAAATAILNDTQLQLAIIDYDNQFQMTDLGQSSPNPNSLISYLSGNTVNETGGSITLTGTLTTADIQQYIENSKYAAQNEGITVTVH